MFLCLHDPGLELQGTLVPLEQVLVLQGALLQSDFSRLSPSLSTTLFWPNFKMVVSSLSASWIIFFSSLFGVWGTKIRDSCLVSSFLDGLPFCLSLMMLFGPFWASEPFVVPWNQVHLPISLLILLDLAPRWAGLLTGGPPSIPLGGVPSSFQVTGV